MNSVALKINSDSYMKIKRKLETMAGKTFLYNTRNHRINNFQFSDDLVIIATDKEIFTWSRDEVVERIKEFLPVENEDVVSSSELVVMSDKKQLSSLKKVIMDNIEKVRQDKSYVQQANAINKSIGTLINVANLELQYLKMLKK